MEALTGFYFIAKSKMLKHQKTRNRFGFTLIELVVVMMMVGILAVAVAPRFSGRSEMDQRGLYDEILAALRYAQKTAIAQRRNVCVTFASNSVSLSIANNSGASQTCTGVGSTALASLSGNGAFVVTGRNSTVFSPPPTSFQFDAQGRPRNSSNASVGPLSVQVSGYSTGITIEQETGYVHS